MPSSTHTPAAPHASLLSFLETFAAQAALVAAENTAGKSMVKDAIVSASGYMASVTVAADAPETVTVTLPDHFGLPYTGEDEPKRSDYSDTKLAELDAAADKRVRTSVFNYIRNTRSWTMDHKVRALTALSLPVPATVTHISYPVFTGRNSYGEAQHETIDRTVQGEMTRDEAVAALRPHIELPKAQQAATAAFGEDGQKDSVSLRKLSARTEQLWPSYPDAE